ncbi:F-box protein At5g03100-like isoform X1 [Eucalyptus grandis]|uniref:F-box protein At5g03100-like isoform X1 n=1 Tax=Eucalyptus grandis TaxID=71139 RepID=UPI00192EF733|nr:F-box protein At5g03100-like isoform X1 [Eucalyptus grandis]
MAETSIHRKSSGDRPNRTDKTNPPLPPPLSPRDLISALPDAVIHRIFSFLPLQDVVKTSVLSKRWRPTWTTATDLVFDEEIVARRGSTLDFSSLVDSVLIQCISPTVKRFHVIRFKYEKAHRPKFDLWLRFAEGRRVEDLSLLLVPTTEPPTLYILPRFLYCWSWLVRLKVWTCCFSLGRTIRWPCLKILVIAISRLSDDILEGIFRGCPVLESLKLWGCWGVKNIMIDSTCVKELVLFGLRDSNIQTIWAPHLLSLRISGDWQPHAMLRLGDVSSLVEAKLDFSIRVLTDLPCDEMMCSHMLKETFQKLCGVTTITIGAWCFQKLSLLEMEGVPAPLSICQSLTLHVDIIQWDLLGIAYMLRISQCLEKLVICLTGLPLSMYSLDEESKESFNYDEEDFLCSRKGNFQCLAKHLKRVEITIDNFGLERLLALIKFLLGDALALEKMIIKANLNMGHGQEHVRATILSKLLVVSQNMLSYRRASRNAEVIFSHSFK